jgi:hypothetical protein
MTDKQFKFTAEDFWKLIEGQGKRCALTERELTPLNCEVELKAPSKKEGRFELSNFYCIDKDLKYLARHLSEKEIIELCVTVLEHRGKEYGYSLTRINKK